MANVTEQTLWESGIYQIETSDAVLGGVNGIANKQALQLANRTTWLKAQGIPTHDPALNYPVGALAKVGAVVYRAISANINKAPASNPTIWETCYLTKAEVQTAVDLLGYAPLSSPALTGAPTAPTAAVDTSTTQVATTAFVTNQAASTTPIVDGTAAVGTSKRYARADHVHPTDTSRAPVASPTLTGTPTAPTATDGTNTTQIASTAFVQSAVGGYLSKSITGGTVTLTDAEASNPVLGFSGTLTSNATVVLPASIKRLWAIYNATSGAYTVTVKLASGTGVTVAQGKRNLVYTDGTNVYDGFNDFEGVALTGVPTAPTAAVDTSTTQIASTAFVINQASSTTPIVDGTPAVGTSKRYARADHVHPTDTSRAGVDSPTLTGVPTAPTATAETASSQLATTAHVHSVFDLRTYKSPDLSIANSGSVTVAHGLGSVPVGVFISLKCAVAEMGYAVGDVIVLSAQSDLTNGAEGLSVIKTATQLIAIVCSNGPGEYPNKTGGGGGVLTAAKWKLILTAIK